MAEKPKKQEGRYLSYLLRLWQESGDAPRDPPLWRASLERPQGGERLGFTSLKDLFAFLGEETGLTLPGSQDQAEEGSDEYSGPQVMG
jgi:hypothetical protein